MLPLTSGLQMLDTCDVKNKWEGEDVKTYLLTWIWLKEGQW